MKAALLLMTIAVAFGSCNKEIGMVQSIQNDLYISENEAVVTLNRQVLSPFSVKKKISEITTSETVNQSKIAPIVGFKNAIFSVSSDFVPIKTTLISQENRMKNAAVSGTITVVNKEAKSRVRLRDVLKIRKDPADKKVGKNNTLSLLSLIAVGLGILLLFAGGSGALLILVGIALGIIALVKKSSGKAMAIIAIILGGALVLFFLAFALSYAFAIR